MTHAKSVSDAAAGEGSKVWAAAFRALFRATPNRLMLRLSRIGSFLPFVEVIVRGRNSGDERRSVVTLVQLDGRWYIGHPNGHCQWVRNLAAAGSAVVVRGNERVDVTPVLLGDGPERSAVIKATSRQPFPANLVYRVGRNHIEAVGSYFRLEPMSTPPQTSTT